MNHRFLLVLVVVYLSTLTLHALPRFASRTNFACRHCHVNPTGGGMRSPFGVSYGRDDVPVKSWQEQFALEDFNTNVTDFLSYGADVRLLYFYQKKDDNSAERSSFFPMQADVYLNLALSKKVNLFVNPAFGPFQRYEVFGLAKVLPANGYIKAGRFTPSYSLRLDDHTSYVREATPFRDNKGQQTGIELAIAPDPISITGAVTNGVAGDRASSVPKALYGRVDGRFKAGAVNLSVGASAYRDHAGGGKLTMYSGFGAASVGERFTVVGEVEQIEGNSPLMSINGDRNARNSTGTLLTQRAMMVEASYLLTSGIDLKFIYDVFDPNVDLKSGIATRYSAGLEFFPVSGVEVRPLYRYTDDTVLNVKTTDIHVLFHFYL
jgi:opacity protein-like surface antigen